MRRSSHLVWFHLMIIGVLVLSAIPSAAVTDTTLWESAVAEIEAGDLTAANAALTQLLQDFPSSAKAPGAQLKLAYIKIKTNPSAMQELIDAFTEVRTKYPASVEAAEALVRIGYLHSKSITPQAIADFTMFLSSNPGHELTAEVQQSLGRLYLKTKELDKAEAAFDKVKTVPDVSQALAEEAAVQSGFVKIMKFYASKDKAHLNAAIDALGKCNSSSKLSVKARADLGIAESLLLLGKYAEARAKYSAAANAYAGSQYFRGMALYGAAVSSQLAGNIQTAVDDYAAFLAILPGTTVAEKDRAWKSAALASTSASAQATVLQNGVWGRVPGSAIVCQAVYDQGKYLFGLKRYGDAVTSMEQLVAYLPEGNVLREQAKILLDLCLKAKGGN